MVKTSSLWHDSRMTVTQGFQTHISAMTTLDEQDSSLSITLSVFPRTPVTWPGEFAALEMHDFFAFVEAIREVAPTPIWLSPAGRPTLKWKAAMTIPFTSDRIPPTVTINFWGRSRYASTSWFHVGMEEATVSPVTEVS